MLAINSVWKIHGIDDIKDGEYRIIDILQSINELILFPLNNKRLNKPQLFELTTFKNEINNNNIIECEFEIPNYQQIHDNDLKSLYKEKRDAAFELIEPLINNKSFIFNFSRSKRSTSLTTYANKNSHSLDDLYRYLNLYWKFGQTKNSLIPAYSNSGGVGKNKKLSDRKTGRPHSSKFGLIEVKSGKNITDTDKNNINKSFKKYCLKINPLPVSKAYRKMIEQYYPNEIERAELYNQIPKIPSLTQYRYWSRKLNSQQSIIKYQSSNTQFNLNKRQILDTSSGHDNFPGSRYEIDATSTDTHIVSRYNRNYCIGRPIFYAVTDVASRMIVGIHVGLEHASWYSARQALINAFTPKTDFCKHYGIKINNAEWPCHHIPNALLCDRGEMISDKAEKATVPLMRLMLAPPHRPDFKGIVERKFGTLNNDIFHQLEGTTLGKQRMRGEVDPRLNAVYTLQEITTMLIHEVIAHNQRFNGSLAKETPLLTQHDLSPTPLNYWNIHIEENMHQLRKEDSVYLRAMLLPKSIAYVTPRGIESNELYYTCSEFEKGELFLIARSNKRVKVEARIDLDNTSFIYVRLNENSNFFECHLTPASIAFKGSTLEDILYFNEWNKEKAKRNITNSSSIRAFNEINKIKNKSKILQENESPLKTKNEKVIDIKNRRKVEIQRNKLEESDTSVKISSSKIDKPDNKSIDLFRSNRKRNKKDEN